MIQCAHTFSPRRSHIITPGRIDRLGSIMIEMAENNIIPVIEFNSITHHLYMGAALKLKKTGPLGKGENRYGKGEDREGDKKERFRGANDNANRNNNRNGGYNNGGNNNRNGGYNGGNGRNNNGNGGNRKNTNNDDVKRSSDKANEAVDGNARQSPY